MKRIKAVGFDHTGVIVGMSAQKFHEVICNRINVSKEVFIKAYLNNNLSFNQGKINKLEFWTRVLREVNKYEFLQGVLEIVDRPRDINKDIIEVVNELKIKGYKLGILSNDTDEGAKIIRRDEHLEDLFDLILVSAETGLAKPKKEAFLDFADKLNVLPKEILFIDDAKSNIETAHQLGMDTILCVDPSDVRRALYLKKII
jgi:putative hydrolase of the HAD superfamily